MGRRDWEVRLGMRLEDLDRASATDLVEAQRRLLAHEDQLDEDARLICEQLVDLLNLKSSREMSELIVRRWPDSVRAKALRAEQETDAKHVRATSASEQLESAQRSRRSAGGYFIKVAGTAE